MTPRTPAIAFRCAPATALFILLLLFTSRAQGYFEYDEKQYPDTLASYVADSSHFWVAAYGGFGLGAMRGTQITDLRAQGYTTSARGAFNGGIALGVRVHSALEISLGAQVMTKGFKVARASTSRSATSDLGTVSYTLTQYQTLKADMLEFPLLLKPVYSYNFGQTNIHLFGGPALAIPLSVRVESYVVQDRWNSTDNRAVTRYRTFAVKELLDGIPIPDSNGSITVFDFDQVYRPIDLSVVMGLGVERVANEHFGFFGEVRYNVSVLGFNRYSTQVQDRIIGNVSENAAFFNKRFHVLYACAGLRYYW